MSPTKIIIFFAIFIAVITSVSLYFDLSHPAIFGRHVSLVENLIAGAVIILLISLILDFTLRRRQEIQLNKVAGIGLSEASVQVNRLIDLVASMIKASSNGLIPKTLDNLFSEEAAELISFHLALDKPAPVVPGMLWKSYLSYETELIVSELGHIQDRYQAYFSEATLTAIVSLRTSPLLAVFQNIYLGSQTDTQFNIQRPVINISIDTIMPLVIDILTSIKHIQRDSEKLDARIKPRFPIRTFDDDVHPKFGDARYDGPLGPPIFIGIHNELPRLKK
jgi:hypothetical protein